MNAHLQKPWTPEPWTIERFLGWAELQDERYEFDGERPVLMTGGSARHSRILFNIMRVLDARQPESGWEFFSDVGLQIGSAVRYPDVIVTGADIAGNERLVTDVRIAFEVESPSTRRLDSVTKVQEYARVGTMTRYVMVKTRAPGGLEVLHRPDSASPWSSLSIAIDGVLQLPEIGIELPVAAFYKRVTLDD